MNVIVNGKPEILEQEISVLSLVQSKGFNPARVVVELNDEILKPKDWENETLKENDTLEIIKIVSGG